MNECWNREDYTIYFDAQDWYWIDKWNTLWNKYDDAKVIQLSPCELKAFEWVESDCKEIAVRACKLISKILNK